LHRAIQTRQLRRQVQEQQRALELHAQTLEQEVEQRTRELLAAREARDALVRDLLDCTLIRSGEFVLHPENCNLVELCQQVLEAYTAGAGLALTFESDLEAIEVSVDRERMSQVLIHLLSNARNASLANSPITITLRCAGDEAIISVCDVGRGMPEELLPHIFDQFYRIPDGAQPGAGLGLYLSRYIVEQHGGRIEVESSPGKGSTFSVLLPLRIDRSTDEMELAGSAGSLFQAPRWLVS
jgi:signal transduction histidine kinase